MNIFNKFYFCRTFFFIALYKILQNYATLTNHESFFQEKKNFYNFTAPKFWK